MLKVVVAGAAATREEAYRLLAAKAPTRVMVDTDLPDGEWCIVRGQTDAERDDCRRRANLVGGLSMGEVRG